MLTKYAMVQDEMSPVDKKALLAAYRAALDEDIAVGTAAANATREAATHEEAKPENDKDTRAIEASYLAGAQAERVRDLARIATALKLVDVHPFEEGAPAHAGAVVETASDDGVSTLYFLAPQGGGRRATQNQREVVIVTPQSPLGQALFGKSVGEVIEVRTPHGKKEVEITGIWLTRAATNVGRFRA